MKKKSMLVCALAMLLFLVSVDARANELKLSFWYGDRPRLSRSEEVSVMTTSMLNSEDVSGDIEVVGMRVVILDGGFEQPNDDTQFYHAHIMMEFDTPKGKVKVLTKILILFCNGEQYVELPLSGIPRNVLSGGFGERDKGDLLGNGLEGIATFSKSVLAEIGELSEEDRANALVTLPIDVSVLWGLSSFKGVVNGVFFPSDDDPKVGSVNGWEVKLPSKAKTPEGIISASGRVRYISQQSLNSKRMEEVERSCTQQLFP